MEAENQEKIGIVPFVYVVLSLIPIIGIIFLILLFVRALRCQIPTWRKIFLLIASLLTIYSAFYVWEMVTGLKNMPSLSDDNENHIQQQMKLQIQQQLHCPPEQIDSLNLSSVFVNSDTITYSATAYACRNVYYVTGTCHSKQDQLCSITFKDAKQVPPNGN